MRQGVNVNDWYKYFGCITIPYLYIQAAFLCGDVLVLSAQNPIVEDLAKHAAAYRFLILFSL